MGGGSLSQALVNGRSTGTDHDNYNAMSGHSLSLFYTPANDTSVKNVEWVDYRPVGELRSGGVLEFNISGNSSKYIDLKNTRLKIKFRILQGNGTPLPTSTGGKNSDRVKASAAPINLFLQSMWRQISPHVSTKYGYRAYMEMLLGYGMNAKESQLQSQMYYKDVMIGRTRNDPLDGGNMGLNTRARMTAGSSIVDMEGVQ